MKKPNIHEKLSRKNSIETFIKTARLDLINAVRSACRRKFPATVMKLGALSDLEIEAVKNGGLLSLPKTKISELEKAMRADNFIWN